MASKRILVVEDDDTARNALVELLADEGYEIRAAALGSEAIETSASWRPHVAVIDYSLPDTNGIVVAHAIREVRPCHIIIMTGTAELVTDDDGVHFDDRKAEARAAGATAYLSKPIDFDLLLRELGRCFDGVDSAEGAM